MILSACTRSVLFVVCTLLCSAFLTSSVTQYAEACSYATSINLIWPPPLSQHIGTHTEIWVDGTWFGHSDEPVESGSLVSPDGTRIPLTPERISANALSGGELFIFRAQDPLEPNTTYAVELHVPRASQGTGWITDIEGLLHNVGSKDILLEWSFETGDGVGEGIGNLSLEGVTWGRTYTDVVEEYPCFGSSGVGSSVAFFQPFETTPSNRFAARYRLDSLNTQNEVVATSHVVDVPVPNFEAPRRMILHRLQEWNDQLCVRLTSFDTYGNDIHTEVLCDPDACAQTDEEDSILTSEEDFLTLGPDPCDGPQALDSNGGATSGGTTNGSTTSQTTGTSNTSSPSPSPSNNSQDPGDEDEAGCTQVGVSTPVQTPWGTAFLLCIGLVAHLKRRRTEI